MNREKRMLFTAGFGIVTLWCEANGVPVPRIEESEDPRQFATCAFYRSGVIYICVEACAAIGRAGRQWSYPGYTADRTPYGVLAHELGHHVDGAHGAAGGKRAPKWMVDAGEKPLTSYCPNANEWFAEMFRLFVTNPMLLAEVRPKTFALMAAEWTLPAEKRPWREVLAGADRQLAAAEKKIPRRRARQGDLGLASR